MIEDMLREFFAEPDEVTIASNAAINGMRVQSV